MLDLGEWIQVGCGALCLDRNECSHYCSLHTVIVDVQLTILVCCVVSYSTKEFLESVNKAVKKYVSWQLGYLRDKPRKERPV